MKIKKQTKEKDQKIMNSLYTRGKVDSRNKNEWEVKAEINEALEKRVEQLNSTTWQIKSLSVTALIHRHIHR